MTRAAVRAVWTISGAVACALVAGARPARAELRETAARLVDEWRRAGATVSQVAPRFVYEEETIDIALPLGGGAECTTVALLGARGTSFRARAADVDEDSDDPTTHAQSVAGALSIERCGDELRRVIVTSDSGRGALEIVVARSRTPLPPLRLVLPERTGGVIPPSLDAGDLPALPAPEKRADVSEDRARRDGAATLPRHTWVAGVDGSGSVEVSLEEGCHRIELFAREPEGAHVGRRSKLDLDAELRTASDDRLLARDRSDAADVRLEACVGEPVRSNVVFAGAPGGAPVVASHEVWPLPPHLPVAWGSEARARMAEVLLARRIAAPRREPVLEVQGGSGSTPVPIALEPGACYVAVAAITQGQARGVGVRAVVGARDALDDRSTSDEAGAVSFCAGDARRGLVEVEARGSALAWLLALYRVEGGVWRIER